MSEIEKEVLEVLRKFMFEDEHCDNYSCYDCGFEKICAKIYRLLDGERPLY